MIDGDGSLKVEIGILIESERQPVKREHKQLWKWSQVVYIWCARAQEAAWERMGDRLDGRVQVTYTCEFQKLKNQLQSHKQGINMYYIIFNYLGTGSWNYPLY